MARAAWWGRGWGGTGPAISGTTCSIPWSHPVRCWLFSSGVRSHFPPLWPRHLHRGRQAAVTRAAPDPLDVPAKGRTVGRTVACAPARGRAAAHGKQQRSSAARRPRIPHLRWDAGEDNAHGRVVLSVPQGRRGSRRGAARNTPAYRPLANPTCTITRRAPRSLANRRTRPGSAVFPWGGRTSFGLPRRPPPRG